MRKGLQTRFAPCDHVTLLSRTHRLVDSPHEDAEQRIVGAEVALFLVLGLDVAMLDFVRHLASPGGLSDKTRLEVLPSTNHSQDGNCRREGARVADTSCLTSPFCRKLFS